MAKKPAKASSRKKPASSASQKRKKRVTGREKRQAQKSNPEGTLMGSGPWWQRPETMLMALAVFVSLVVYIMPLVDNYGFVNWDDPLYVTENPRVQNPSNENFVRYWTEADAFNYHPLTMTSLGITYRIFGEDPFPYHLTNIILHLINVVLVFMFVMMFSKGNKWMAFFVAFVFGTHPMHVESVAWVAERKDVLFTLFFVWSMILYLKYLATENRKLLIYVGITFILSLLSKPTAVVLPAVLVLIDYYYKRPLLSGKIILEKVPFFVLSLIFGYITVVIQSEGAVGDFEYYTFWEHIMFASYGFVMYIVKLFVPVGLVAFYPYPDTEAMPAIFLAAPFITLLMIAGTILSMRKTRIIAFGMGFYAVTISLTLQFFTVGSAVMADRYTYVPYIGLLIMLGFGLDYLIQNRPSLKNAAYGAVGVVMLLWAFSAFQRTQVWENDLTLWEDVIEKYPDQIAGAHMSRGKYYKDQGQLNLAFADFNKSIELDDTNDQVLNNRGNIYFSRNQDELALPDYNKAIEIDPNIARYYDNRGALYARQGNFELAIPDIKKAIELDPEFSNAYKNLAVCYSSLGNAAEAANYFGQFLKIFPKEHGIMNARAIEYQRMGKHREAIQDLTTALVLASNVGVYYGNRALSHAKVGNKAQGLADINKAVELGVNRNQAVENILQELNALP